MTESRVGLITPQDAVDLMEALLGPERGVLRKQDWPIAKFILKHFERLSAPPPPARERREAIALYGDGTNELADLRTVIERIPADFPNYGEWECGLPAGHWRTILAALPEPTPGDEAVERVARALCESRFPGANYFDRISDVGRDAYRIDARAAIAALTPPTGEAK